MARLMCNTITMLVKIARNDGGIPSTRFEPDHAVISHCADHHREEGNREHGESAPNR